MTSPATRESASNIKPHAYAASAKHCTAPRPRMGSMGTDS